MSSDKSKLVTVKNNNYEISWSLNDNENSKAQLSKSSAAVTSLDKKSLDGLTDTEKKMTLGKTSSQVTYQTIYDGVDLRYTLNSGKLKEDIILSKIPTVESFSFNINTNGLIAKLKEDKTIDFYDPENKDTVIFSMTAPYMYDSSKSIAESTDIDVVLTETNDGYILVMTPSSEWLKAEERVYPVTIDPTVYNVPSSLDMTGILDTYVHPGDSAEEHVNSPELGIGNVPNDGLSKALIQFPLPDIGGGNVFDAKMHLKLYDGTTSYKNINVYKINSYWDSYTVTNDDYLNLSKSLIISNLGISSNLTYVCDISSTTREWYDTGVNYGVAVTYYDDDANDYNWIFSSEFSNSDVRPYITVSYSYSQADGIIDGAVYNIRNQYSQKYVDVYPHDNDLSINHGIYYDPNFTVPGVNPVVQYTGHGGTNQQWRVAYQGNGYYKLMI